MITIDWNIFLTLIINYVGRHNLHPMANELHSYQILSNGVKPISFETGHDIYH